MLVSVNAIKIIIIIKKKVADVAVRDAGEAEFRTVPPLPSLLLPKSPWLVSPNDGWEDVLGGTGWIRGRQQFWQ